MDKLGLKDLTWVILLLAHNSFAVLSGAGQRNNFCNGAWIDPHKMKAALKVQFTFPLNEILADVKAEESPTHEVGAAVSFTTTDCYCQFNELKALRFLSICKGRQHEMVGIIWDVATLLMGYMRGSKAGWCSAPRGCYSCLALCLS